jgi:hypothetical protein
MRTLIFVLLFAANSAHAFIEPNELRCKANREFAVIGKKRTWYKPGNYQLPSNDVGVLEVRNSSGIIAKLYPRHGLDYVVLQKEKFKIVTDNHSTWTILNAQGNSEITCELVND